MSVATDPSISEKQLLIEEEASAARELSWLLLSLQDTLTSLRTGLQECIALIHPAEPASTLVLSSSRSESLKGYVTRVGDRIVKGDMQIKMYGLPPTKGHSAFRIKLAAPLPVSSSPTIVYKQSPLTSPTDQENFGFPHNSSSSSLQLSLSTSPPQPIVTHISGSPPGPHVDHRRQSLEISPTPGRFCLPQLTSLRTHLNHALHMLTNLPLGIANPGLMDQTADETLRLTAQTMAHLNLVLSEIRLAKAALTAPNPKATFPHTCTPAHIFDPPLPDHLSFDLTIHDGALVAEIRTVDFLHPDHNNHHHGSDMGASVRRGIASVFHNALPSLGFGSGGAQRPGLYEEVDKVFKWQTKGEVRVKDKIRVESQDPRLMSVMMKVGGLEHATAVAMGGLEVVRGAIGVIGASGEVATGVVATV